jgi:hypothetical protein
MTAKAIAVTASNFGFINPSLESGNVGQLGESLLDKLGIPFEQLGLQADVGRLWQDARGGSAQRTDTRWSAASVASQQE